MARSYARVLCSIWSDDDFVALPATAQRLYLLVLSQRDLDPCGVIALRPKVWATKAPDSTPAKVDRDVQALAAARFLIVDTDTDEVLVRSFLAHEVVASPNMLKAAGRRYQAIVSPLIRAAILEQIPKPLREGFPEGFPELSPKGIGELIREGFPKGSPKPPPEQFSRVPTRAHARAHASEPGARSREPGAESNQPLPEPPHHHEAPKAAAAASSQHKDPNDTATHVADLLAQHALDREHRNGRTINHPDRYTARIRNDIHARPELADTINRHPDWPPQRIAAALDDDYRTALEHDQLHNHLNRAGQQALAAIQADRTTRATENPADHQAAAQAARQALHDARRHADPEADS